MSEEKEINPSEENDKEVRYLSEEKSSGSRFTYVATALLTVLVVVTVLQSFQISTLSSEMENIKLTGAVTGAATAASSGSTSGSAGGSDTLQQVLAEITPTGTPDYGAAAGVSYDRVEEGLKTLTGYAALSLNSEEQQRYSTIANTDKTACNYCCGATKLAQNCGCSHNKALQGLSKWLIKNTEYSNDQILKEIHNWQILFFPKPTVQEELQKRNINPESVGLPAMRGGC
jgi:hypothetical protein